MELFLRFISIVAVAVCSVNTFAYSGGLNFIENM